MVYFIQKKNQKPHILTFGHTKQVNLNTSNLTSGFFTNDKMVFSTTQIKQKNWVAKKYIIKKIAQILNNKNVINK